MKIKVGLIAVSLCVAPFLRGESDLRPVSIRLTRLASGEEKELALPAIVVSDTKEARLQVGPNETPVVNVSVSPKLDADQVTLTLRFFAKDREGKERATSWPLIVTKLGTPVEVRCGTVGYRVLATLDSAR